MPEDIGNYAQLPEGGDNISIEKALNSRCSSDYDENQRISHWGMFDRSQKLQETDIQRIIELSEIRRLSSGRIGVRPNGSQLFFLADPEAKGLDRDRLMVESGMQQQAVSLVCAALGVGSLIMNLGLDGKRLGDTEFATVRMQLGPMKPSYDGSYWSSSPPEKERRWRTGNLPDPARDGNSSLISALNAYRLQNKDGHDLTWQSLGQVLWAARGRTPHFYNCTPWGMTIPTWTGKQDITTLNVITREGLFEYVNWRDKRPTHSLKHIGDTKENGGRETFHMFSPWNCFVVLYANETHARGLWEVGYQVLNILLQAHALNLAYQLILLDNERKNYFRSFQKAANPVTVIGLNGDSISQRHNKFHRIDLSSDK